MGGTSLCTIEQEVGATTLQPLPNSQPWAQPASFLLQKLFCRSRTGNPNAGKQPGLAL